MLSRRTLFGTALAVGVPMINRNRFSLFAGESNAYSVRTIDLVRQSTVIDMLSLVTLDFPKLRAWQKDPRRFSPSDLEALKRSGITVFHPAVGYTSGNVFAASYNDIHGWNRFIQAHANHFLRIDCPADLTRARELGKIGILLGQQNSIHFRSLDDVNAFHAMGQRVSQLTYYRNRLGYGSTDTHDHGLTKYGAEIVERMNEVGMAVDVSHCGDRTTLDALEVSRKPVLITHSNCRTLVPSSPRCRTDEAIRKMAATGGVMGITMLRGFVRTRGPVTMEHVLDHIDYVARLAGVEHVGIGTDVDLHGRDAVTGAVAKYDLDGVRYSKKIFELTDGLVRRNYSDSDIVRILGANFHRALTEIAVARITGDAPPANPA
jgi:membrane dipeptidase